MKCIRTMAFRPSVHTDCPLDETIDNNIMENRRPVKNVDTARETMVNYLLAVKY